MKIKFFVIFLFFYKTTILSLDPNDEDTIYIVFSEENIIVQEKGPIIEGTKVLLEKPGKYLVSGKSNEGNIEIRANSVNLFLLDLNLSSKKDSPIIINSKLNNITITNLGNTILNDLEDYDKTDGECAVIKIRKHSIVYFKNNDIIELNGNCKSVIKGGKNTSLIFEKSFGEYKINANKTGIISDNLLQFDGGIFTIHSKYGEGIKSLPDKNDTVNLGKILINDGTFNIYTYNDAFLARNNITIKKGNFEIKTENGYDSTTYDENESSKGFKLTNNETGCGITIYSGFFSLNTADDAFHSKGDIKIFSGKYIIFSKDDGISAKHNLIIGIKDTPNENLDVKILNSYEALEGMAITIYSGKIIATAIDDGINASGEHVSRGGGRRPPFNDSEMPSWIWNETERELRRNRSRDDQGGPGGPGGNRPPRMRGNASFYVSIYDAEIYIFCDGDGIDSNGNIFIHGGNINVFSQGNRDNEPIDHDGNFTLFDGDVLGVGSKGIEYIHAGIKKGNQMYAYNAGPITKNKILEIYNEQNILVKEGKITKDINYIFYSSPKLNKDYHFYIIDIEKNLTTALNVTFNIPEKGDDIEDKNYDGIKNRNRESNNKEYFLNNLKLNILIFMLLILF